MSQPFLSVVIPAYNEEARIGQTLRQVADYLSQQPYAWEEVVADDGSTDQTAAIVEQFQREIGGIALRRLPHGGKGWAVKHGMLNATGQYRFLCDADLSMPIEQVARFLPPALKGADIAIGSREAPGARWPWVEAKGPELPAGESAWQGRAARWEPLWLDRPRACLYWSVPGR